VIRNTSLGSHVFSHERVYQLKLIVNETKSGVVPICEASFLGFQIVHRKVRWSEKSHKKFKAEEMNITGRTRGVPPTKVMADLETYLVGAINYDVIGTPFGGIRELDGWLRRRMRLCDWNRPVRNRMPGGVGGAGSIPVPARFCFFMILRFKVGARGI
jgi:hypothetical protein